MPDGRPNRLRLFVSLAVPEAVKAELERAQAELRAAVPRARVRWAPREQLHLTLKFLGDVEPGDLEGLARALGAVGRAFPAPQLVAERVGFFPIGRLPRVIWAAVQDRAQELPRLQRAIEQAVRQFTAEPAEHDFSGHVTLGRIKAISAPEARTLTDTARTMATRRFGEWTADSLALMQSRLSPGGAIHSCARQFPLNAGR